MKVTILGSGKGSNARALLEAQVAGRLASAKVVGIISDQPEAGILRLGKEFNVQSQYIDPAPFKTKLEGSAEEAYIQAIQDLDADLVVLAGFMRVIKKAFLQAFDGKIINLHPSLLPEFPGLDAIGQAYQAKVKETGCTVHWVNEEVDGGTIIAQKRVSILSEDTLESLETKVHSAEHILLPQVVAELSNAAVSAK